VTARERRPTVLIELAVVVLIIAFLSACLLPIVRNSGGPAGDPIPKVAPDEAHRIYHPSGFSIVVPPDWSAPDRGSLALYPKSPGRYARRSKAFLLIAPIGGRRPEEVEGLAKTSFQGQEAFEGMEVIRHDTFDDPPWSEYRLIFRRGEDWYLVQYGIAEERTTLPDMVRRYIDTLSWEGRPRPGVVEAPAPSRSESDRLP
jgi:hypothetical protein